MGLAGRRNRVQFPQLTAIFGRVRGYETPHAEFAAGNAEDHVTVNDERRARHAEAFRGIANPLGAINSASLLLDFVGEAAAAEQVRSAVADALAAGAATADLGGPCTTAEMGEEVVRRVSGGTP